MLHQQIPQIFTLIQYNQNNFRIAQKKKSPCKTFIYKSLINKSVPLKDEILNLWNDFLAIVDFIQANPEITKIIVNL